MNIQLKRIYELAQISDGKRVLVDRLWPRGLTKSKADIDVWLKDIAPTTELRKWFDHDPAKWNEFRKRYIEELKKNKETLSRLTGLLESGKVTLVYGAKNEDYNDAVVLKEYLENEKK